MGSWDTYEIPESRAWRIGDRWQDNTMTTEYVVTWTSTGPTDFYPGEGALIDNIPHPQTRPEAALYGGSGPYANWIKEFILRSVEINPIRERTYSWRVRATYSTPRFLFPNTGTQNGYGTVYLKQTRISTSRQVALYRLGVTPPSGGTAAFPPTTDIGGTKVDVNGKPMAGNVTQQQISVEFLQDRTPVGSGTTAVDPDWNTLLTTYINKRNNAAFLGWPTGSVLCTGATATLDSEVWRVQIQFLFDEWYHLIQFPVSYPTGEPILNTGPTLIGIGQLASDKVGWFQQFPNTATFNNIFGAPISDQFTKAGPFLP